MKWTESVGLTLIDRDLVSMTTEGPDGEQNRYEILQLFPFTSERKRMGIIVRVSHSRTTIYSTYMHNIHVLYYVAMQNKVTGEIVFYVKGADSVMTSIVQYSDWLEEEVESYNIYTMNIK